MTEAHWVRHSIQIAGAQVRSSLRKARQNPSQYWLLLIAVVCGTFCIAGLTGLFALYLRHAPYPIMLQNQDRIYMTVLWGFFVVVAYRRATWYSWDLGSEKFLLTTISARTAITGIFFGEFAVLYLSLLPATLCLAAAFVYGLYSPLSLVTILVTEALGVATAGAVGYAVGFAVLARQRRSGSSGHNRRWLIVRVLIALAGLAFVLASQGIGPQLQIPSTNVIDLLPPGWLIDVMALGTPIKHSLARAVAAVVSSVLITGGGGFLVHRLVLTYWYGAPDNQSSERSSTRQSRSDGDALVQALFPLRIPNGVSYPVAGIATERLVRLRRSPRRATFFLIPPLTLTVLVAARSPNPWVTVATMGSGVVPWAMGAIFGLNPLGDEGAALPSTLLSLPAALYVRGVALPAILVGIPLIIFWVGSGSLLGSLPLTVIGGDLLVGSVLTVSAAVLAPAIGVHFPNFDAVRVGSRTTIVLPSWTSIVVYTLIHGLFGSLPGIFVRQTQSSIVFGIIAHLPPALIRLAGVIGGLTVVVLFGMGAYLHTIHRISSTVLG